MTCRKSTRALHSGIRPDAKSSLTRDTNTRDQGVRMPIVSPHGTKVSWATRHPGGTAYYTTGSFTSDGESIAYTSYQDTHSFWHSQIYRLDLASGTGTRMTTGNDYNERPTVIHTPTGDRVVYMSTRGVDRYPFRLMLGTDWYAMRLDGSGDKRLTAMNVRRPDGSYILGDVQDSLVRQSGLAKVVRFVFRK